MKSKIGIEKHYVKKTVHKSLHKICEINGYMKYGVKQMIQMINFSIIFDDNNMIKFNLMGDKICLVNKFNL